MKSRAQILNLMRELDQENLNPNTSEENRTRNSDAIIMLSICSEYITKPELLKQMLHAHSGAKKEAIQWVLS